MEIFNAIKVHGSDFQSKIYLFVSKKTTLSAKSIVGEPLLIVIKVT